MSECGMSKKETFIDKIMGTRKRKLIKEIIRLLKDDIDRFLVESRDNDNKLSQLRFFELLKKEDKEIFLKFSGIKSVEGLKNSGITFYKKLLEFVSDPDQVYRYFVRYTLMKRDNETLCNLLGKLKNYKKSLYVPTQVQHEVDIIIPKKLKNSGIENIIRNSEYKTSIDDGRSRSIIHALEKKSQSGSRSLLGSSMGSRMGSDPFGLDSRMDSRTGSDSHRKDKKHHKRYSDTDSDTSSDTDSDTRDPRRDPRDPRQDPSNSRRQDFNEAEKHIINCSNEEFSQLINNIDNSDNSENEKQTLIQYVNMIRNTRNMMFGKKKNNGLKKRSRKIVRKRK
jgi:hypothetical protein